MWTRFMDMHSGGSAKVKPYEYIYVELPEDKAKVFFYNRFGRNPERVTCTCCGDDYAIDEKETLEQATGFERGCHHDGKKYIEEKDKKYGFREYMTLAKYLEKSDVLVIRADEIKPEETKGEVPDEGYRWVS